jgi:thiamine biosynthesis lipoprotein
MGGTVQVSIGLAGPDGRSDPATTALDALAERTCAERALDRLAVWADRLTRFDPGSELSRLNADPRSDVTIGRTLASVLDWGRTAEAMTDGIVDITLLDARLRAETVERTHDDGHRASDAPGGRRSSGSRSWSLSRGERRTVVHRPPGLRFDIDGVAKGWLADRALRLAPAVHSAIVDADGDVAVRLVPGASLEMGVADPRHRDEHLAVLRLAAVNGPAQFGVATSGTTVHRWPPGSAGASAQVPHHLIDPTTGLPALSDLVQATVLAGSAREAEAYAKAAVIVGSAGALRLLGHPRVLGVILLTGQGDVLALPSTLRWLA